MPISYSKRKANDYRKAVELIKPYVMKYLLKDISAALDPRQAAPLREGIRTHLMGLRVEKGKSVESFTLGKDEINRVALEAIRECLSTPGIQTLLKERKAKRETFVADMIARGEAEKREDGRLPKQVTYWHEEYDRQKPAVKPLVTRASEHRERVLEQMILNRAEEVAPHVMKVKAPKVPRKRAKVVRKKTAPIIVTPPVDLTKMSDSDMQRVQTVFNTVTPILLSKPINERRDALNFLRITSSLYRELTVDQQKALEAVLILKGVLNRR